MESPFPKSSSAAGDGCIIARPLPGGGTGLQALTYQYPLKLISPSPKVNEKSVLVFLLSYGGGLVGGDKINLSVQVQEEARLSLVTQGHTKIFKSPAGQVTSQTLHVQIAAGGALCLLPDPVQPFENSHYVQTQIFRLAHNSSLCFLDWVTQGRTARGEDWSFDKWSGRNEVWTSTPGSAERGRLLVRDTVILSAKDSADIGHTLRESMHQMGIFGTLILSGSLLQSLGDFFLSEFAILPRIGSRDFRTEEARRADEEGMSEHEKWRTKRIEAERHSGVLWSAARIRGCVVVKFGAKTVEAGREWIGAMVSKEGSAEQVFGEQALMCLK